MIASVALMVFAAARYPGGTTFANHSAGFDWSRNFISALFQPTALNGAANPARYPAIFTMLAFCLSVGYAFWRISRATVSVRHRKMIEIGGVGSMVYALLAVTPMHNLMVDIALLFYLVALLAMMHCLYVERAMRLFTIGAICNALLLLSAVIYYGNVVYWLLPVLQKLTYISCSGWVLAVYYGKTCVLRSRLGMASS
jgi:hypothetical protein